MTQTFFTFFSLLLLPSASRLTPSRLLHCSAWSSSPSAMDIDCSPAHLPTSFFFLLPLFPLPPPLFPFCCNRRQAKRREDRGARATTMATWEELQPRYWESCKRRFPVLQPWTQKLHPVDKKTSTRQRNAGKVTTVLTKSFNPQMKKLQTEIEKILLDDDHGVSLCFCCNRRVKSCNPL